jgi:hypothetical protein
LLKRTSTCFYPSKRTRKGVLLPIFRVSAPVSITRSGKKLSSKNEGWPLKRSNSCATWKVYTGGRLRR